MLVISEPDAMPPPPPPKLSPSAIPLCLLLPSPVECSQAMCREGTPERFRLLIMLIVDDGNDNVALFLAGQEREGSLYSFVVFASNCSVILC